MRLISDKMYIQQLEAEIKDLEDERIAHEHEITRLDSEVALWKRLATDYHKMAMESVHKLEQISYLPTFTSPDIGEWCIEPGIVEGRN